MSVEKFLEHAELRLAQSGYAETFAAALNGGASNEDALRTADVAMPEIIERVEALFAVLRRIADEPEHK